MKKIVLSMILATMAVVCFSQQTFDHLKAPDIAIQDWVGEAPPTLEGKAIVLEFWATWCGACIEAIPHLNEMAEKYGSDSLLFISINTSDQRGRIEKFLLKQEMKTFVAMDDGGKTTKQYVSSVIPCTVLIDKNGYLRWKGVPGLMTDEFFKAFLEEDKIMLPEIGNPLLYSFNVNLTKDRSVSGVYYSEGEKLGLSWKNRGLANILDQLYGFLNLEKYEYRFEGKIPLEPTLDVELKADRSLSEEYVYNDAIEKLSKIFGFTISTKKENVELWELSIASKDLLAKAVSVPKEGEKTYFSDDGKEVEVRQIKNRQIPGLIMTATEAIVVQDISWDEDVVYDMKLPKTSPEHLSKLLEEKYGLRLLKTIKEIEVKVIEFK